MRLFACVLALLLLLPAFGLPILHAEEGDVPTPGTPAAPRPDPKIPSYSIEYLMPGEDEDPEGWKLVDADKATADAPTEDGLTALAEGLGLDDDSFYVETTGLKKGDGVVGVALVDVEKNVYAFHDALKAAGASAGWRIKELGSPARLLVLGGTSALLAQAEEALVEHAIYRLGRMAMDRMNGRAALEDVGPKTALHYREAIDSLVPNTGIAHAITGRIHHIKANKAVWQHKIKDAKVDKAENKIATDFLEKALADGVKFPPRKSIRVWVGGTLGSLLLELKDKSLVATATRALEIAVESEKDAMQQQQRYSNRYNLACGYALGGQTQKALDTLALALETMKSIKPRVARQSWEGIEKDKDFDSIRNDPRFSKIYADGEPPKPKHWDRDKAAAEKRKREQEAK